jgi:hypothetical protein
MKRYGDLRAMVQGSKLVRYSNAAVFSLLAVLHSVAAPFCAINFGVSSKMES